MTADPRRHGKATITGPKPGRPRRGWILLPAAIIVIAVVGILISSFQKEVGLASPSDSGRAAVAALVDVERTLKSGEDYDAFSTALLVAVNAHDNMAVSNPADTRLDNLLKGALDCFAALREAWQADLDGVWEGDVQGRPTFWDSRHPFLHLGGKGVLAADDVVAGCHDRAATLLAQAVDLAE